MAISKNFLPKFELSKNLANDLRNIEIAKALSTGWYKGQFNYFMNKIGAIATVNGVQVYTPIHINSETYNFFVEGTRGYYIAELLRLIGFDDDTLNELHQTWRNDSVDGLDIRWRAHAGYSTEEFKKKLENLKKELIGVDSIEIDYTNQAYKKSVYTSEPTRLYNTKESLYGNQLLWGEFQGSYLDLSWTVDGRITTLNDIITRTKEYGFGNTIRFYSAGIDVSADYSDTIKRTVQSMIMYSGTSFMERTSSVKQSENEITISQYTGGLIPVTEQYIEVTGTETFDATIKQTFLDDEDDTQFIRYTKVCSTDSDGQVSSCSESPDELEERVPLNDSTTTILTTGEVLQNIILARYAREFWNYVGEVNSTTDYPWSVSRDPVINAGDEFLFIDAGDNKNAYIIVSEFNKLSIKDVGYYLGEYFNVDVSTKSGAWYSGIVGALAGLLGMIFNFAYDIFKAVPLLRLQLQVMTYIVNKLFSTDFSDEEMFKMIVQIIWTAISILLAPVTLGLSIAISVALALAIAGSNAEEAKDEQQKEAEAKEKEQKKLAEEKKLKQEEEEKRKQLDSESGENEQDEFQMFLKNPLYKVDREKDEMISGFEKQFKLL